MREPHGGNIYRLAEHLGIREWEVADFSASVNPLGLPVSVVSAMRENMAYLVNYPDPDTRRLRLKIAEDTGADPAMIVCGNGSTELIYLIVRALRPTRVLIPAPTFSEYERACKTLAQVEIRYLPLREENSFDINTGEFISAMEDLCGPDGGAFPMAFLCNPNNPTGRLLPKNEMIEIADAARDLRCALVVDEAFVDFCPGSSVIDEVSRNPYLIVLRSLTKIYALSGLRIGYAVIPLSFMSAIYGAKEPWTVNSLAQVAGIAAIDDAAYRAETFRVIAKEKKRLEEGFDRLGISHLPPAANYFLLRDEKAPEIKAVLREKGILVRDCSNFIGLDSRYLRVAVKSEKENMRLLKEIASCGA